RQRGVVVAVVEENGCGGAGGIAGDVGERLLGAAVESEACLGGERAGAAVDRQGDLRVHVVLEGRDERFELADAEELIAAQRADSLPGVGETVADEVAGTLDRGTDLCACLFMLGKLACALQLDRSAGERVREHIMQLARDPAALTDRRRLELFL